MTKEAGKQEEIVIDKRGDVSGAVENESGEGELGDTGRLMLMV